MALPLGNPGHRDTFQTPTIVLPCENQIKRCMDEMRSIVEPRIEAIEHRIEAIERKVDTIEKGVAELLEGRAANAAAIDSVVAALKAVLHIDPKNLETLTTAAAKKAREDTEREARGRRDAIVDKAVIGGAFAALGAAAWAIVRLILDHPTVLK